MIGTIPSGLFKRLRTNYERVSSHENGLTITITGIPALVCECGEAVLRSSVASYVSDLVDRIVGCLPVDRETGLHRLRGYRTMSMPVLLRVTSRGRITLPRSIQEGLQVHEGESLALQKVADGIVMLFKAPTTRQQLAERLLKSLVIGIGQEAEKMDIREEEDLDAIVKVLRRHSFERRYGSQV